jgi:hypothetical protein
VFGGPLNATRLLFADYWRTRSTGTPRPSTVPTSLQRRGIFSTAIYDPATTRQVNGAYVRDQFLNDTIPAERWDPAVKAVLDRYPLPNVFVNGQEATANNYVRTANEITNQDQFGLRFDHNLNRNQRIFGRYEYLRDKSLPSTPLPDGSGLITAGIIGDTVTRADSIALEHAWTLSGNKVNQLRFGYTRRGFDRESLRIGRSASEASGIPNIPVSALSDTLPTYDVVGFQQLGPPTNGNASFTTSVTQFVDNLSWLRGRHSLKLGTDWVESPFMQPPNPTGAAVQ